jgi:AraC-like DNA-binding protein
MGIAIHRASQIDDSAPLPVYLRATGWYNAKQGWTEENNGKERNHAGLFWCMDGSGNFTINGKKFLLKSGQVFYYHRHASHKIFINSPRCTYYWVTFDGPLVDEILASFKYPSTPFYAKGCLVEYFEEMFEILHDLTPAGLQKGSQSIYKLLIALGNRAAVPREGSQNQKLTKEFVNLTKENFTNESYNVGAAAEVLKVHRTTLGRAIKEQLNISPNTYITNIRLQQALRMLYETDLKASEIAAACGIPDPCYFSKQIKQLTGLPPHKLRNN